MAFSHQGNILASGSGSDENSIKLWGIPSGILIKSIKKIEKSVYHWHQGIIFLAFSPDSKDIISGSFDSRIKVTNISRNSLLKTTLFDCFENFKQPDDQLKKWVKSISFSPTGQEIVITSKYDITVWDVYSEYLVLTIKGEPHFSNVAIFSPSGDWIVSGSKKGIIQIYDRSTQNLLKKFKDTADDSDVLVIIFLNDEKEMVTQNSNGLIRLWEVSTGNIIRTFKGEVLFTASSPDGKEIINVINGGFRIMEKDPIKSKIIKNLEGHSDKVIFIAFSHDESEIVSVSADKTLKIWNSLSGKVLNVLEKDFESLDICSIGFSNDGKEIFWASGQEIAFWNRSTNLIKKKNHESLSYPILPVFKKEKDVFGVEAQSSYVMLFDKITGQCLKTLLLRKCEGEKNNDNEPLNCDTLLPFSSEADAMVGIVGIEVYTTDVIEENFLKTLTGIDSKIKMRVLSPNGKFIVFVFMQGNISLLNTESKTISNLAMNQTQFTAIACSADGKFIAVATKKFNYNKIQLYDSHLHLLNSFDGTSKDIVSMKFLPNNSELISRSVDNELIIWENKSEKPLHAFPNVYSVSFSSDSNKMICGCADGSIKVWERFLGRKYLEWFEGGDWLLSKVFSRYQEDYLSAKKLTILGNQSKKKVEFIRINS